MEYIWYWFISLHNCRTSSGFGVNPIQYSEMLAYFQLICIVPLDWEINAICRLDKVALEHVEKESEKERNKKSKSK